MAQIAIINSRECELSDQTSLRRFVCCGETAPEYALDVQRYIRDIKIKKTPVGIHRMVLYSEAYAGVFGFCEYGYDEAAGLESGYAISFIATAQRMRGRHLGRFLLDCVLRWMANDAAVSGRNPYVMTQIDRRNDASVSLFRDLGFENEGQDLHDSEYDI